MAGNGMKGMNIDEGRSVLAQIEGLRSDEETRQGVLEAIKAALEASWHGADSQALIEQVDQAIEICRNLQQGLEAAHQELDGDIQEQEQTSAQ